MVKLITRIDYREESEKPLTEQRAGEPSYFTPFRSFPPLCFARALWQIAPPPFRGVAAVTTVPSVTGGGKMSRN